MISPIINNPGGTILYAGLFGLFYFLLSVNVIRYRWKEKKGLGHDNDPKSPLFRAIRTHGNFMEYVPFILFLMFLDEVTGRSLTAVHSLGSVLLFGRLSHFLGIRKTHLVSRQRFLGSASTFLVLIVFEHKPSNKGVIMKFFTDLKDFLKNVANDERIPGKDKKILLALIALVISPIDFIPDWIPVLGQLDDLVILAIILDYFFTVLDSRILLSHYPWGMKSFARLRAIARFLQFFVPRFFKRRVWSYVGDPY